MQRRSGSARTLPAILCVMTIILGIPSQGISILDGKFIKEEVTIVERMMPPDNTKSNRENAESPYKETLTYKTALHYSTDDGSIPQYHTAQPQYHTAQPQYHTAQHNISTELNNSANKTELLPSLDYESEPIISIVHSELTHTKQNSLDLEDSDYDDWSEEQQSDENNQEETISAGNRQEVADDKLHAAKSKLIQPLNKDSNHYISSENKTNRTASDHLDSFGDQQDLQAAKTTVDLEEKLQKVKVPISKENSQETTSLLFCLDKMEGLESDTRKALTNTRDQHKMHHIPQHMNISPVNKEVMNESHPSQDFDGKQLTKDKMVELVRPSNTGGLHVREANEKSPILPQHIRHLIKKIGHERHSDNRMMADQPAVAMHSSLRHRTRFNMSITDEPLRGITAEKLVEIIHLMRTDCKLQPSSRTVRWVSSQRGILFECHNGAWVITDMKRKRRRRIRPSRVEDCYEANIKQPSVNQAQVQITYSDLSLRERTVLCSHTTNEDGVFDNHIDTEHVARKSTNSAWTVIQRRHNGSVSFYRSMKDYKDGFGDVNQGEYWLGLQILYEMTQLRQYKLRIQLTTADSRVYFSEYDSIRLGSQSRYYKLKLGALLQDTGISDMSSAGDILFFHDGGKFQAKDSDGHPNCAKAHGSPFWYDTCLARVNINGLYNTMEGHKGVRWASGHNVIQRVWKTEMMIQPITPY